jgi:hypothetical protein
MKELTPSLHVHLQVEYDSKNFCPLEVKGSMFSSNDRLLSVGETTYVNDRISGCNIRVKDGEPKDYIHTVLSFPVEANSFHYVEKLRLESEKKDVILKFEFKIVYIEHNFDFKNNMLTLRDTNESNGAVNLFKVNEFKEIKNRQIPLSEWVNEYKNTLGFGKVMLFEINQPSLDNITNIASTDINVPRFKERIEAAISELSVMQDYMRKAEWNHVAEHFRNIELFKEDMTKDLQTLLQKTTNLPEESCQHFTMALGYLHSFSNYFHHLVDKKKMNPIMNVNKEDADFFYMFMLSITQLIIKKIEYLKGNTS